MTTPSAEAASPLSASDSREVAPRHAAVIRLLLISAFVVILNETIMGVAIPRLMASLGVDAVAAQWLTTAFLLTMAVVIPITGFLLQRLHTRTIFVAAMTLFCLGTLVATLAPGLPVLVIARVIQASGTAIMLPLLMTTVMTLVPAESRGKTMGNIMIVISVAPALGPFISGLILRFLPWQWLFALVLPIAFVALLLGARRMQNVTTPREAPLDLVSVLLSALGFGGWVYGLSLLGVSGNAPHNFPVWTALAIGSVGMVAFVVRQIALQRHDRALLDLRTFASRNFTVSVVLMAIMMMALFGTLIVLPLYLQNVRGFSPLEAGLLLLPGGLVMGLLGRPVGRQYDRIGPAKLLIPGVVIVTAVLWAMTLLGPTTPWAYILAGHIVISAGFALLFTPLFTVSLSSVQPRLYSHGSAVLGSTQQLAGAVGVALFIAFMSTESAELLAQGATALEAQAGGIRAAFLCGAVASLAAVVCALFVRKPESAAPAVPH